MKPFLLFFLVTCCFLISSQLQAQCGYEFSYNVKPVKKEGNYTLELELLKGDDTQYCRVELYDLRTSKEVAEREQIVFKRNKSMPIFKGQKSSFYTVFIYYPNCEERISVGGAKGIRTSGL
jgi:hypothetical protein